MNILIACEESQRVCACFRLRGHNAFSCDLEPCSGGHPEWHIMQDVLPLLNGRCSFDTCDGTKHEIAGRWDMVIAFPPCTFITKAGARWMYPSKGVISNERLKKALAAKRFFLAIMNCDCYRIAIENPTPLKVVDLPKPSQTIQPYQFGHPYSKKTCLWLKNLPPLIPTMVISDFKPYVPSNTSLHSKGCGGSYGVARSAAERSKTFLGVADAMAEQWGALDF